VNGNPDDTAMISPDGRQVAFWSSTTTEGQKLHAINADGSNPRILLSAKTGAVSLCGWSPDGNRILATSSPAGPMNNQLLTISVADGSSKVVASGGVLDARFSPDGRYIAIEKVAQKPPAKGIFTITATGEREVLLVGHNNASHPIWTEDGKRVLFSLSSSTGDNDLWSIRVIDGRPEGIRELVKKGVPRIVGITQNGDLYYAVSRWPSTLYTVDVDPRTGETTSRPTKMATGYENGGAAWSPDGNTLAYRASRIDERFLVLRSVANGQERPLAPTGLPGNFAVRRPPVWFPDGKSILLWFSDAVYQTDLQTGESRQLLKSLKIRTDNHGRFRLAPDGRTVYYTYRDQRADVSLIRQSLDGGTGVEVCRVAGNMSGPSLSPDGTSLVFSAEFNYGTDKEYCTVMIVAAIGGEPREVLRSKTIMQDPVWSKDGRWLFFSTNNEPQVPWGAGRRQDIWRVSIKGGEPKPLNIGLHFAQYLDFSSDGKHLVFSDLTHINELRVMRNLFPPEKPSR
jgi:Tol biopolymer transport system component